MKMQYLSWGSITFQPIIDMGGWDYLGSIVYVMHRFNIDSEVL